MPRVQPMRCDSKHSHEFGWRDCVLVAGHGGPHRYETDAEIVARSASRDLATAPPGATPATRDGAGCPEALASAQKSEPSPTVAAAAPRTPTPGGAAGILCPHIADLGHEDGACSECYGEAVQLLTAERSRRARVEEALRTLVSTVRGYESESFGHDVLDAAMADAEAVLKETP